MDSGVWICPRLCLCAKCLSVITYPKHSSDPYCVFAPGRFNKKHKLHDSEARSSTRKKTCNPDWDETLMLNMPSVMRRL